MSDLYVRCVWCDEWLTVGEENTGRYLAFGAIHGYCLKRWRSAGSPQKPGKDYHKPQK